MPWITTVPTKPQKAGSRRTRRAFDGGAAESLWESGAEAGEVAEVELAGAFGGGGGVAVGGVPEPGDDGEFVGEPGVLGPARWDELFLGEHRGNADDCGPSTIDPQHVARGK